MDDIIKRIRALRSRAEDPASSVAEAETAAARATKLIMEHDVSEADLLEEPAGLEATVQYASTRKSIHPAVDMCKGALTGLTETIWIRRRGKDLRFAGLPADVEFALYLVEVIRSASERAWKLVRTPDMDQKDRRNFLRGFGVEMRPKLQALTERRQSATGTDLVVVKTEIIRRHEVFENTTRARIRKVKVDRNMYDSGRAAGSQFDLRRPVGAGPQHERIG